MFHLDQMGTRQNTYNTNKTFIFESYKLTTHYQFWDIGTTEFDVIENQLHANRLLTNIFMMIKGRESKLQG